MFDTARRRVYNIIRPFWYVVWDEKQLKLVRGPADKPNIRGD